MAEAVTPRGSGVRIALKVIPRSPREDVSGVRDGRLLVRVTAPPVDSAANEAVIDLFARFLAVPRRNVSLVSGQASRLKIVDVEGVAAATVRERFGLV